MNKIREQIVQILLNYEEQLTDGYTHYCGDTKEDVEAKLDEIAGKIVELFEEYEQTNYLNPL